MDTELIDAAVRIHALDVTAQCFSAWHAAQRARLPSPHEFSAWLDDLPDAESKALNRMLNQMPSPGDLARIEELIEGLGEIKPLQAEDREYVSTATLSLYEGLRLAQRGHWIDSFRSLEGGRKRIHWIVYERKRRSEAIHRSLSPPIKSLFVAWLAEMDSVLTVVGRAAKAVSR